MYSREALRLHVSLCRVSIMIVVPCLLLLTYAVDFEKGSMHSLLNEGMNEAVPC